LLATTFAKNTHQRALLECGHVALLTDCASEVADSKTIKDSLYLLQHCGFDITIPNNQRCYGAIGLHAGKKSHSLELAQQNGAAFSGNNYDAIITLANGCGSTLAEYDHPLSDNIVDISDFIAPFLAKGSFEPLNASAWLHTPCTFKNAPSKSTDISTLLTHIGELTINSFEAEQACCALPAATCPATKKRLTRYAAKR